MKKSQLTEMIRKIVREAKTIREEYTPLTPQQKAAQQKLALARKNAAMVDAQTAQQDFNKINKR
jgi:hypothetical protein